MRMFKAKPSDQVPARSAAYNAAHSTGCRLLTTLHKASTTSTGSEKMKKGSWHNAAHGWQAGCLG